MSSNTYTTHRRQLYMLPTKAGYIFSLIVFLLFLASVKFSHQATFLLTFLLCGFGAISALHTQKNLNHISLTIKNSADIFLGENTKFVCEASHSTQSSRNNLWLVCGDHHHCFDLEADSVYKHIFALKPEERGIFNFPAITLTSHYPLGILFGWSKAFKTNLSCIVYPKPKNLLPKPNSISVEANEEVQHSSVMVKSQLNSGEISSLRPYRAGDRLRDIDWPSFAKSNQLISREYESKVDLKSVYTWQHVISLNLEDKLSQLTYWLIDAEKNQQDFQLIIPGYESDNSSGKEHLRQCLTKLALWGKT